MESITEAAPLVGVLQDATNVVNAQPEAEPPVGFIPRSKPTTPPIYRKIRSFQLANWGQAEELTLKQHRCLTCLHWALPTCINTLLQYSDLKNTSPASTLCVTVGAS